MAVRDPATTQLFEPCPFGRGSSSRSRPSSAPAAMVGGSTGSGGSSVPNCVGSRRARRSRRAAAPCPSSRRAPRQGRRTPPPRRPRRTAAPGVRSSSVYSTGGAGIRAIHAATPSRKRACIAWTCRPSRRRGVSPARWKPIVRANRSSASVRSANTSDSRPFAARSSRSSWNRRSPAVTKPCANQRSSSEAAVM